MTAIATIDEVVCLRPTTSTDFSLAGVINAPLKPVYATTVPSAEAQNAVWPPGAPDHCSAPSR